MAVGLAAAVGESKPHIEIRGIYGGNPAGLLEPGSLDELGINAVFMNSRRVTVETVAALKQQGAKVFAEYNTMHLASFLEAHPDAAPIGIDGQVSPPPHGWQGICPSHEGYRQNRMHEFRRLLRDYEIDGIWLDYHHSHASWERAEPAMPDTCFCERCVQKFAQETKTLLPEVSTPELAQLLLGEHKDIWVEWRCDLFTDWVREFRAILDETRPGALLGTYHCPWSDSDYDGGLRDKLAIDLEAQAEYIDVFSIMPYHARFGHADDPAWISRQVTWLGEYLGIRGVPGERHQIWPIVQLSDWGEPVPIEQIREVLDHGTRLPATGVMVFNWGSLRAQTDKVEEMAAYYLTIKR